MLGMTRWTPWTELAGVHRDLDSLFNRVFGDTVRSQSVDAFTPAADLRRDGELHRDAPHGRGVRRRRRLHLQRYLHQRRPVRRHHDHLRLRPVQHADLQRDGELHRDAVHGHEVR